MKRRVRLQRAAAREGRLALSMLGWYLGWKNQPSEFWRRRAIRQQQKAAHLYALANRN